ncbi:ORF6N domain-containing protein [Clostridium sp. ZBS17]|uniref:ORF6N domain-containing protein n=1 Tax=Clostridium sp. ZBS17 TaxID=2949968 RepID=UPI0014006CC1|nr:ORF6N domain-containing protein [Clostridium sp. ZBS17]NFI52715.1 ORF6N domain-containing protein [Clostridium botulinum]
MNKLIPLEFKNQRIMTTKILAEEYGTEDIRIQQNYLRNKERFIEGKHFHKLEGEELKRFKTDYLNDSSLKINSLILWTDRGASRHAKILDTDEAWNVYEELEENYFNPRANKPTCIEDILISSLQEMKSIKGDVAAIKQANVETKEEIQGIREITGLNSIDWKDDSKKLIVKIAHKLGGNQFIQDVYKEVYSNLEKRVGCQLQIRLTNKRRRMADEGICKSKRDKLNKLDIIGEDKKILECFLAIVKELAIKYGA